MKTFYLICCAASASFAASGPIMSERVADRLIDSFESAKPRYRVRTRGAAKPKVTPRAGIARQGNTSLLVQMPPARAKGRNSVIIEWAFDPPADWSRFAGLSVAFQTHGRRLPTIRPVLTEASGAHYWVREPFLQPRREGEWQVVELPFKRWTWSWEAGKDPNGRLDLNAVKRLWFEIRAFDDAPLALGIDSVGLYNPRPAYAGPVLRLLAKGRQARSLVQPPGGEFSLVVELRQLRPGQRVDVRVTGVDYWGRRRLDRTLSFVGPAPAAPRVTRTIRFPADRPGYVALTGVASAAGKPAYRYETGAACVKPMDPGDAAPNPHSIFGVWVGGGHEAIGAKWDRRLIRITSITKVGETYQFAGGKPGVPVGRWGWGPKSLNRIACFVSMAKWLSSKPDRADYYKWSPSSWDEYAKVLKWIVSGTSKAGIRHYEVWNEPVPYAGWMGPMESVVKLHEVTYRAVKAVQPDAVVLGPCPYTFKWDFLKKFFELGGGRWIDAVVIHAYDSAPPDAHFRANMRKLRALLKPYGFADKDIYITEWGYRTPYVTEHEQAQYLVRAFVYARAERVRALIWHMLWDWSGTRNPKNHIADPGHAIKRFDHTPRPAWVAYAVMTRMLENARFVGSAPGLGPTQRGFVFERRGERIRVLWDVGPRPTTYVLKDASPTARRVSIVGDEARLRPRPVGQYRITLGSDSLYVVTP